MSINFEFNNRANKIVAYLESTEEPYANSPVPGFSELLCDLIKEFDRRLPLEELEQGKRAEAKWLVHDGPAVYVLTDTTTIFGSLYPSIIWVGECSHMRKRIRDHQRKNELLFDGVRGVFIEHARMRRLIEKKLIKYFRDPNSGHADTIENKRI